MFSISIHTLLLVEYALALYILKRGREMMILRQTVMTIDLHRQNVIL